MKLLYLTSLTYPSTTASAHQIKCMSRAFSDSLGDDFCLAVNTAGDDSLEGINYQAVNCPFKRLRIVYYVWLFLKNGLPFKLKPDLIVYTKDPQLMMMVNLFKLFYGFKTCFELHIPWRRRLSWIVRGTDYFVVINRYLKELLGRQYGLAEEKIIIFPDAVDLAAFQLSENRQECRKKLGLPQGGFLAGYVGRFKTGGKEKGIKTIIESISLTKPEIKFCLVGGQPEEIDEYRRLAKEKGVAERCLFIPYQPENLIPYYLKSMDCLLMPFPRAEHYEYYMSPLKLFEYLAAHRPIIASDLPSVREILNEDNALLVEPGSISALALAVEKIFSSLELAENLSRQAGRDAGQYTWPKRASVILNFLNHKQNER
jgi:glycosyltransferase involved in cell wall biosynthesis